MGWIVTENFLEGGELAAPRRVGNIEVGEEDQGKVWLLLLPTFSALFLKTKSLSFPLVLPTWYQYFPNLSPDPKNVLVVFTIMMALTSLEN